MDVLRLEHPVLRKHHRLIRILALALVLIACAAVPFRAASEVSVGIGVSVGYPPPPLPLYLQPPIPGPDYIWIPGYWAWGDDDYYWVPGYWALPPYFGALWTPGYWGWFGGVYVFHGGYWAHHVGFYGGICYGYGYPGHGYYGGRWEHDGFHYNRSVNQINNVRVTNVYNGPVPNNGVVNRTSFNGGRGGVTADPTRQEAAVAREAHVAPVAVQTQRVAAASHDPAMRASVNHGAPAVAGAARAAPFNTSGVHAATVQAPQNTTALRSANFAPRVGASHAAMPPAAGGLSPGAGHAMSNARSYPSYNSRTYPANNQRTYQANTPRTYPAYNYHPMNNPGVYHMAAAPRPAPVPASHAARPAPNRSSNNNGHH
ncbi:YXWGXW repeat-containing protein [Dyella silvae]|uniref:YXWGXW repeat-containing protein n=1 Tax=Dyella silvae TaxID=2994424 RepID=UPI002264EB0F|nr:YXWGXW repeat-containing protein [Dyella silvae]